MMPGLIASACGANRAKAQETFPPAQDGTQPPAPIVRPKPIILKPRPAHGTSAEGAGTPGQTAAPKQKAAVSPAAAVASTTAGAKPHAKPGPGAASGTTGPIPKPAAPVRQQPTGTAAVPFNRTTVVLDPAHGGVDGGARITDSLQEKDVDLQFAFKLRSLLSARGFTVVLTRENDTATTPDSATPLSLDDRAGDANRMHAVACLLIHSTGSGKGVHLYSSELTPVDTQPAVIPWLSAQASWVNSSRALQKQLGTAVTRAEIPLVMSRASVRPLDSLTCPALVLEIAPESADKASVNDSSYQTRIANALAAAFVFWQNQAHPPDRQLPAPSVNTAAGPGSAAPNSHPEGVEP